MPTNDDRAANATQPGSGHRGRRRRAQWVFSVAVSVAAAAGLAGGVTASSAATMPARADAGMPRYYVISSHSGPAALQVRTSATGRVTGRVAPPAACDPKTFRIAGAADDPNFVVGCDTPYAKSQAIAFYRLRIDSRGHASALRPLAIRTPAGSLDDLALTPDGRRLAISMQGFNGAPGALEVVTLATGRVRTWTGGSPYDLSWVGNGRELGFFGSGGLYGLNPDAPGTNGGKLSSAHLLLSRTFGRNGMEEARLSPDGTTIIASVIYASSAPLHRGSVVGGIVQISVRTGKVLHTLVTQHAHYSTDGGGSEAGWYSAGCMLGPIDSTGQHLLAGCDHFGRLDRARFTALPGVAQDTFFAAAW